MKKAFTLIELLIVVAIIGILAAIAVPNFLNAQTKAAVARVQADFKAIQTALEMYALDNGSVYPPDVAGPNDETKSYKVLTTPVAYLSSVEVFRDFFTSKTGRLDEGGFIRNYYDYGGASVKTSPYYRSGTKYVVISFAPDRTLQYPWGQAAQQAFADRSETSRSWQYSNTNGISSRGDLFLTGFGLMNQ